MRMLLRSVGACRAWRFLSLSGCAFPRQEMLHPSCHDPLTRGDDVVLRPRLGFAMKTTIRAAFGLAMLLSSSGVAAQTSYYIRQHLTILKAPEPAKPVFDGTWNYRQSYDYGACSAGRRSGSTFAQCFVSRVVVDSSRCRPGLKPSPVSIQFACYNTCSSPTTPGALAGPASSSTDLVWSDLESMRTAAHTACEGMTAQATFLNRECHLYVNEQTQVVKASLASSSGTLVPVTPSGGFVAWHGACSASG